MEKVVRESIESSMEKHQPEKAENMAKTKTFIIGEDALNDSSDGDNLVMDLSEEERV